KHVTQAAEPGPSAAVSQTSPPPQDLAWNDLAPAESLRVVEELAAHSKTNYEKIKTWRGAYSYVLREYLSEQFAGPLLLDAQAGSAQPAKREKPGALIKESTSVVRFALDVDLDSIYRDIQTSRMRFLSARSGAEVKIPNVGPDDHRSIITKTAYFHFAP